MTDKEKKELLDIIETQKIYLKADKEFIEGQRNYIKKLEEKLEHIKEAYIRFEDSEKEYNKGLGELDQLIMNR